MNESTPSTARHLGHVVHGALDRLRSRVEARFGDRLRRCVLFGSYARGDAGPESDVDVLVQVDHLDRYERRWLYETGAEIWMDTEVRIAPMALSTEEYDRLVDLERLLVAEIEREGIPL